MKVTATRQPAQRLIGRTLRETDQRAEPGNATHALVATGPEVAREPAAGFRQAPFLAQLIATRDQIAQTRERRRAEPGEAIAAYRATEALLPH